MNGEIGLSKNPKDAVKWFNRSVEAATAEYPEAIYELALLHITGVPNIIFVDQAYAVRLLNQATELGYAPAAFKLGECYEYGKLDCQPSPALSIHYYTVAAEKAHKEACFALTAWYLVGAPKVLPQSDENAYIWAKRAADMGLPKAEYAVGYFTEMVLVVKRTILKPSNGIKKLQRMAINELLREYKGKQLLRKSYHSRRKRKDFKTIAKSCNYYLFSIKHSNPLYICVCTLYQ
jgi:TPR repeat protein